MLIREQIWDRRTRTIDFARGGIHSTFHISRPTRRRNTGFLTSRHPRARCSSTRCLPLLPPRCGRDNNQHGADDPSAVISTSGPGQSRKSVRQSAIPISAGTEDVTTTSAAAKPHPCLSSPRHVHQPSLDPRYGLAFRRRGWWIGRYLVRLDHRRQHGDRLSSHAQQPIEGCEASHQNWLYDLPQAANQGTW